MKYYVQWVLLLFLPLSITACISETAQFTSPITIPSTPIPPTSKSQPPTPTLIPPTPGSPSPSPSAVEFILDFFNTWNEGVNASEIEDTLSYFADDATLETVDYYHLVSKGRNEIRTSLEHWINSGYVHFVDQYEITSDDDSYYWSLDSTNEKAFCYGKVTLRGLKITYLGYTVCKSE